MTVVHILLIVLKITGILLLVLLGLVLFFVLAVFFCPVRYTSKVYKAGENYGGNLKITWLFHLVSFKALYEKEEGGARYCFRILGISTAKATQFFKKIKKKVKLQKTVKNELAAAEREEEKQPIQEREFTPSRQKEATPKQEPRKKKAEKKVGRTARILEKIRKFPGRILRAIQNFSLTVRKICGKISQIKEFLEDDRFLRGKKLILKEVKKLLFHIKPVKMEGYIKFGTKDPCTTGEILAAAGIFYPLYGEHFTIEPCFEEEILEGNLWIRGRVYGVFLALMAWRIFTDSDIRYIIRHFKSHSEY